MDTQTIIPEITHSYGKYWHQPDTSEILIDQHHAIMTEETYNKLEEYNMSFPTGAYNGKMWKSTGHLCWYYELNNIIHSTARKIIII